MACEAFTLYQFPKIAISVYPSTPLIKGGTRIASKIYEIGINTSIAQDMDAWFKLIDGEKSWS
jgi:hypothetical protein